MNLVIGMLALHTFSHANAVHQGLRRIATRELLRGVFDGAMRVYLNRFLNVPLVPLPKPTMIERNNSIECQAMLLKELPSVLDKQAASKSSRTTCRRLSL